MNAVFPEMMKNPMFDLENGGGVDLCMRSTHTRVNTVTEEF